MGIPHDLDAEHSIVGGCLPFPDSIPELIAALDHSDFYDVGMAKLWAVIGELHRAGTAVDHVTISDAYGRRGWDLDPGLLVDLMAQGLRPRPEHVEIVLRHSAARRLLHLAGGASSEIQSGADPHEIAEQLRTDLATLDVPSLTGSPQARTLDDIIASADDLAPFVIPGLFRRDWRVIVVGGEGMGKSTLLRQMAACPAQGIHPLHFDPIDPIRVLLIDLENPAAAIAETGARLVSQLQRTAGSQYDPQRLRVLMRPGGIDIRARHDRVELEREIVAHRPDLVVIGPVYKMFQRREREQHEEATDPVLRILDDLRTRHGFALLMEHHAPQGFGGTREIRPYGSQRWLAWPELGIGLKPTDNKTNLALTRWRGDRLRNEWPDEIRQDKVWPFVGIWNQETGAT
jgi:replicative DNA helicase